MFSSLPKANLYTSVQSILSSANAVNLVTSKVLPFGIELRGSSILWIVGKGLHASNLRLFYFSLKTMFNVCLGTNMQLKLKFVGSKYGKTGR